MPTIALQSQYWPSDQATPPVSGANVRIYSHPWRVDGSMVGMGVVSVKLPVPRKRYWWEKWLKRISGWWIQSVRRRLPGQLLLLKVLWDLLTSTDFQLALEEVQATAVNPRSRNLEHWSETDRMLSRDKVFGENVYRAAFTYSQLHPKTPTLNHSERHLLLELAHMAFKLRGR